MRRGFSKLVFRLHCLIAQEEGQTMIEYGLLASLITLGFVALFKNIGAELVTLFTAISSKIVGAA
jgi:Flp pilus assembly pilin Flp